MIDLKAFRDSKKLCQKEPAKLLGVGQSFLSKMENGKEFIPEHISDKLTELFGYEDIVKYLKAKTEDKSPIGSESTGANDMRLNTREKTEEDRFDRLLNALERRDQLAFLQQKEYEKQGGRIDELISLLKKQMTDCP